MKRKAEIAVWVDRVAQVAAEADRAPKRLRSELANMDSNIQQQTPEKQTRKRSAIEQDDGSTPTPRASWLTQSVHASEALRPTLTRLSLHRDAERAHLTPSDSLSEATETSQSTGTNQSSKRVKRTQSPTKTRRLLENAEYGITEKRFAVVQDLPEAVRPLARKLKQTARGHGILPNDCDGPTRAQLGEELEETHLSSTRKQYGTCPEPRFIEDMVDLTARNLHSVEAMWNCSVHYPSVHEACRRSPHYLHIRDEMITTARIEPDDLVPILRPSPDDDVTDKISSKKVDIGIAMRLDADLKKQLYKTGIRSLSPTMYAPLTEDPLALSIETKRDGGDVDDAINQISIWGLAHISKLRRLLHHAGNTTAQLPFLPAVYVQGGLWTVVFICPGDTTATLWNGITFGDTASPEGVHQVVTGIGQLIDEWIEREFRPWFMNEIVHKTLEHFG
ncbi:Hypothetical protein R9X50_00685200 [Acrodontium crateriforme]|uniref:PD-(D/E)XK nuclease-like domain-containing protein n=1 Tax=Acrodontium crateriforme TaxID=150365 RepID=A0AAQ3M9N0_9PEZI|nr:Hypothetical protein R9X50_00685200 [Acrodontium crateriforme]